MTISTDNVKLEPANGANFKILQDYKPFNDLEVTIPQNYVTNGADIPRIFWSIVPPFYPQFLNAVVVHDYFCDLQYYEEADKYFEALLLHAENSLRTNTMVFLVKAYHKFRYDLLFKLKGAIIALLK